MQQPRLLLYVEGVAEPGRRRRQAAGQNYVQSQVSMEHTWTHIYTSFLTLLVTNLQRDSCKILKMHLFYEVREIYIFFPEMDDAYNLTVKTEVLL